jgi:hypothetical protein
MDKEFAEFERSRGSWRFAAAIVIIFAAGAVALSVASVVRAEVAIFFPASALAVLALAIWWQMKLFSGLTITRAYIEQHTPLRTRRLAWNDIIEVTARGFVIVLVGPNGARIQMPAALYQDPEAAIRKLNALIKERAALAAGMR